MGLRCLVASALLPLGLVASLHAVDSAVNRAPGMTLAVTQNFTIKAKEEKPEADRRSEPEEKPAPDKESVAEKKPATKDKAAPRGASGDAWTAGLNAFFGSDLQQPDYDAMLEAAVTHLNGRTLSGVEPKMEYKAFEAALDDVRQKVRAKDLQSRIVEQLYRNLTDYVVLEADFTRDPKGAALKRLVDLVEAQSVLDVDFEPERKARIIDTIHAKDLFVPSTILFGAYVLPYRPMEIPDGWSILEIQGTPEFVDSEYSVQATYDFLDAPGAICRVDFESVGPAVLSLARSKDGKEYAVVQEWKASGNSGLRAPVIPDTPFRSRYLRITAQGPSETAVLRNTRVLAFKETAAAVCPMVSREPDLDASFKDGFWPQEPQVDGFVCAQPPAFAESQTTVRVCHTKDTLLLAVYARESRMDTMLAKMTEPDAPLLEEESVEFIIERTKGTQLCFAVNPLGTRFESKNRDLDWNGDWKVATKNYPTGWAAEIAIPFSVLGGAPKKGEGWTFDVVRMRRNVKNERSSWAYSKEKTQNGRGRLIFN